MQLLVVVFVTTFFCPYIFVTEQEMDGSAISFGVASTPGPDWLRDVVPVLGLRLKVHNRLRSLVASCQVS